MGDGILFMVASGENSQTCDQALKAFEMLTKSVEGTISKQEYKFILDADYMAQYCMETLERCSIGFHSNGTIRQPSFSIGRTNQISGCNLPYV